MTKKLSPAGLTAKRLRAELNEPPETVLARSRARVRRWFSQESALIAWGEMKSPLGPLFVAINRQGVCALDFGRGEAAFLNRFDARARLAKNPEAVEKVFAQLREYFAGGRSRFELAVDFTQLPAFQRRVLETACRIAPGEVWTYQKLAQELGNSHLSRPVGQALARNPVPIVIPCHRIVAANGGLGGYSGGSGLEAKRWLLRLEGAL